MSRVLAFVGDDPGQEGATCLLGVLDDPDGPRHGEVVYAAIWDHVLRTTDRGQHVDPDAVARGVAMHAVEAGVTMPSTVAAPPVVTRFVIELPRVGGRMFSAAGVVTQGANYGVVLGAALCSRHFVAECVEDADPGGGQWYAEAGAVCPKGKDRKQHSIDTAHALLAAWSAHKGFRVSIPRTGTPNAWGLTPDRADALLLAHLGVLRWLGRAVAPAVAGAAVAAKARTKLARDHEVARALEGVDAKVLKVAAVARIGCPVCPPCGIQVRVAAGEQCRGKATCRERVWAMAAGMKTSGLLADSTNLSAFNEVMRGAFVGTRITCKQGVWRREGTDGLRGAKVSREALDAAIDAGLVRFTLDDKRRPVWVVTSPGRGVVLA